MILTFHMSEMNEDRGETNGIFDVALIQCLIFYVLIETLKTKSLELYEVGWELGLGSLIFKIFQYR